MISHVEENHPEIDSLRIDTHADNQAMQHLINKMAFTKVGEIYGVYHKNDISYVYERLTSNQSSMPHAS